MTLRTRGMIMSIDSKGFAKGERVEVQGYGSGEVKDWLCGSIVSVKLDRGAIIHVHSSVVKAQEKKCR